MKQIFLFLILYSNIVNVQSDSVNHSIYTNTNTLEVYTNRESGFSDEDFKANVGFGYTFESDYDFHYVMEVFIKSKEFILNTLTNYNYQMTGMGLSLGLKF